MMVKCNTVNSRYSGHPWGKVKWLDYRGGCISEYDNFTSTKAAVSLDYDMHTVLHLFVRNISSLGVSHSSSSQSWTPIQPSYSRARAQSASELMRKSYTLYRRASERGGCSSPPKPCPLEPLLADSQYPVVNFVYVCS